MLSLYGGVQIQSYSGRTIAVPGGYEYTTEGTHQCSIKRRYTARPSSEMPRENTMRVIWVPTILHRLVEESGLRPESLAVTIGGI